MGFVACKNAIFIIFRWDRHSSLTPPWARRWPADWSQDGAMAAWRHGAAAAGTEPAASFIVTGSCRTTDRWKHHTATWTNTSTVSEQQLLLSVLNFCWYTQDTSTYMLVASGACFVADARLLVKRCLTSLAICNDSPPGWVCTTKFIFWLMSLLLFCFVWKKWKCRCYKWWYNYWCFRQTWTSTESKRGWQCWSKSEAGQTGPGPWTHFLLCAIMDSYLSMIWLLCTSTLYIIVYNISCRVCMVSWVNAPVILVVMTMTSHTSSMYVTLTTRDLCEPQLHLTESSSWAYIPCIRYFDLSLFADGVYVCSLTSWRQLKVV